MRPYVGAFGVGLVPGGQQVDVTNHPVTTARETQPAERTDGCRSREKGRFKGGGGLKIRTIKGRKKELLTVERSLAHVGTLVSAHVALPLPILVCFVFDEGGTRSALRVTVGKGTFKSVVATNAPPPPTHPPACDPPPYTVGSLAAQFR